MKLLAKVLFAAGTLSLVGISGTATAGDPPGYEIQKDKVQAAVGVPGKAALTVQGKNGWHVNEQAPITLTAKGEPGVDLPKPKLNRSDLTRSTKDAARFEIPFTAAAAGTKTITAEARFVICQEQACKPVKETVALEVEVASASSPTALPSHGKPRAKSAKPRAQ